ncbi:MAG: dihydroorotate dehydrogenase-like protein [Rhodospirillales bacterium]|nr:dihydroorotate dehydrogenase-like protein [Rhodospirillales bacterium]
MDLKTTYLGLELKHPIVASASPLSRTLDGIRRMEDAGASAIVMFSLFEEQIRYENDSLDYLTEAGTETFAESLTYFPSVQDYRVGPDSYLELIRAASKACEVPIIASLNGVTSSGWIEYAREMIEAGAKAIELNIYYIPADLTITGREVEQRYIDVVKAVRSSIKAPISVKLSPFFSSMGEMATRLVAAGADGLVLFNRFYQPDFDLDELEVIPDMELSTANEIRLPLLWIAVLHGRLKASLAATRGVQNGTEVVKYLMAGADAVMTTSALLRNGVGHLSTLLEGTRIWMEKRGYSSVAQMKGSMSQSKVADPAAFERANYIKVLQSYKSPYIAAPQRPVDIDSFYQEAPLRR